MQSYYDDRPAAIRVGEGCFMNLITIIIVIAMIVKWIIRLFTGGP